MRHIKKFTPQIIKKGFPPAKFYSLFLNGTLGKPKSNGWHEWNGLCPFHDDHKSGSFDINVRTGGYKCHSCSASGGDILDFYMAKENLGFTDTLKQLGGAMSCAQ